MTSTRSASFPDRLSLFEESQDDEKGLQEIDSQEHKVNSDRSHSAVLRRDGESGEEGGQSAGGELSAERGEGAAGAGTSLFHQRLQLRRLTHSEQDMKSLLHRLVVVSARPGSTADGEPLGARYEALNLRLQRQHHMGSITGLLLAYPSCLLHVMESSSEVLVALLQTLQDMQDDCHVEPTKVVHMSHDVPNRLFQQWSYKMLTLQTRPLEEDTGEESTDALVGTVRSMILKLGSHLEIASETLPGSVLDETPELVVPQEVLVRLLDRPELLSPKQYLQAYHSPLNICMDTGHVFGSGNTITV